MSKLCTRTVRVRRVASICGELVLVVKFKAYVAMLRCWCTSPDAREKK